jgi:cell fate regulator YaaT (PSP1 superfamily)
MRYIVRHGVMRLLGDFEPAADAAFRRNQDVVLETERGLEIGEILCEATPRALGYLEEPTRGRIVRAMTDEDRAQLLQSQAREDSAFHRGIDFIRERKLQMELVDVENLFGGERLIFYFLAEKRVDFRDLVKDLAREFRTRIEMQQTGLPQSP